VLRGIGVVSATANNAAAPALHEHLSRCASAAPDYLSFDGGKIPRFTAEFWTAKQRQGNPIHEVSYRACFKAQLPGFFIGLLSSEGDVIYDPFAGRGTTAVEAALNGRIPVSNDVNPLSEVLARPRIEPPSLDEVQQRLLEYPAPRRAADAGLSMFYHPDTEAEILALRDELQSRRARSAEDATDRWIRMVATNRLSGHSPGFFSVYTLPPNQAASRDGQVRINRKRRQAPPYRNVRDLIARKSRQLLSGLDAPRREAMRRRARHAVFIAADACETPQIPDASVALTVTSPPFLDTVQYAKDNWLRCWFNGIDAAAIERNAALARDVGAWQCAMTKVFRELHRVTRPGGWVAFEVGEVRNGRIRLEEHVLPAGTASGFRCTAVMINRQQFTKTSNIWGVGNNCGGTNTNRIVLFRKD